MKAIILLFLVSIHAFGISDYNIIDNPEEIPDPIQEEIPDPIQEEEERFLKGIFPCYKKEINITEQEWPFHQCVTNDGCPDFFSCEETCVCEPIFPEKYIYLHKGFIEAYDPSFLDDPLNWFNLSNRTKKIVLQLKYDTSHLFILPVREDEMFERFELDDEIKLFPEGIWFKCSQPYCHSFTSFSLFNVNKPETRTMNPSLLSCFHDIACERENYERYHEVRGSCSTCQFKK